MQHSDPERLATVEQAIRDIREDIADVRTAARDDHHRLRDVEAAVALMLEAHKEARRAEDKQYRRLELRIQVLTAIVGLAAVVSPLSVLLAHH